MEKHIELSRLLDLYGGLLTQRQRSLMEQSLYEDCSLAEIAEREGISRQGVRDALRRGGEQLALMEAKLGLFRRERALLCGLNEMLRTIGSMDIPKEHSDALTEEIKRLIDICEEDYGV